MNKISRSALQLPFGLNNEGRMVSPTEVQHGQACDCVCPACGLPVLAINRYPAPAPGKQRPHFRHATGAACSTGLETAIHRMAKQILVEAQRCWAPAQEVYVRGLQDHSGRLFTIPSRSLPPVEYTFSEVVMEPACMGFRPDVTGVTQNGPLHIEIRVTHAVQEDKSAAVFAQQQDMIEIDLSAFARKGTPLDVVELTRLVVENMANKRWIYSSMAEVIKEEMRQQLREKVRLQNNEQSLLAMNVRPPPNRHPQHQINGYIARLRLQHQWVFDAFEVFIKATHTANDWVFLSPRSDWQQYIESKYLNTGIQDKIFNIEQVIADVRERYKVAPAISMLDRLGITAHLNWGVDILTAREKSYLPGALIKAYLKSMANLGYVRRINNKLYQTQCRKQE